MKIEATDETYRHGGARALVRLHEREMQAFLATWERARAADLRLPESDDPNYASLDTLLHHVLRAGRGYMVWMCSVLELPDPGIRPAPSPGEVGAEARGWVEHLLERWRRPLVDVAPGRFERPTFESRWGVHYCVDAMLEHAVMHPVRHGFQLEELMARAARG